MDAQTAPTAPWKTLRVFHKLPQGTTFTTSPTENPEEPFKVRGEKQRKIDNPDELLKFVQRRIRERLLAVQRLPALVRGCVRGESPFSNAEPHCDRRNVASIDIRNFYPSVGHGMVYNLWRRLGFEPALSGLLTRLTTTAGRLPQGAPTSDTLANLVLGPTDGEVANISHLLGLEPSRYLDDITLSGDRAQECIPLVIGALRRQGFSVRHKKTSNAGPSRRHSVTGYSVNAKSPSVPQPHRMKVRALVHHLILARQRAEDTTHLEASVKGHFAYIRRANPGTVARLEKQLAAAGIALIKTKRARRKRRLVSRAQAKPLDRGMKQSTP